MNRGSYGKIPVVMGDYDTELGKEKIPRSWYANSQGELYFVAADGVNVINVWKSIINEHEKEGDHDRFYTKAPINLTLMQEFKGNDGKLVRNKLGSVEIHGTHEAAYGYSGWNQAVTNELVLSGSLPLGLSRKGVVLNGDEGTCIEDPLTVEHGGTGSQGTFNDGEFISYNASGKKFQSTSYFPYKANTPTDKSSYALIDYSTYNSGITALQNTNTDLSTKVNTLESKITTLENLINDPNKGLTKGLTTLNSKVEAVTATADNAYGIAKNVNNDLHYTKESIDKFIDKLPKLIYRTIFPTTQFNEKKNADDDGDVQDSNGPTDSGTRILQIAVIGANNKNKRLRLTLNNATGYGATNAGNGHTYFGRKIVLDGQGLYGYKSVSGNGPYTYGTTSAEDEPNGGNGKMSDLPTQTHIESYTKQNGSVYEWSISDNGPFKDGSSYLPHIIP